MVAGAANNQLLGDRHGEALRRRGILYAPDYVINAGGLMNLAEERHPEGYDRGRALRRVEGIPHTPARIFEAADRDGRPTNEVADRMARQRLGREPVGAGAVPVRARVAALG